VTYAIYTDRSKYRRGNLSAILGIFLRAHHAVVAVGEHAADCAKDDDGEDGDDNTAGVC